MNEPEKHYYRVRTPAGVLNYWATRSGLLQNTRVEPVEGRFEGQECSILRPIDEEFGEYHGYCYRVRVIG